MVGPDSATRAIVFVYDILGVWPQTLQGADLLSSLTGALVLMPDFFAGGGAEPDWLPPNTDEKKKKLTDFVATKASFDETAPVLLAVRKALAERFPAVDDHVGVFGLCWGGKRACFVSLCPCLLSSLTDSRCLVAGADNQGPGRRINVTGTAHPGYLLSPVSFLSPLFRLFLTFRASALDAKDAEALTAPHILLASKNEPVAQVAEYKSILAQPGKTGEVTTYPTMFHGWMGARADLADADNVREYTRGYEQVAAFFSKHL